MARTISNTLAISFIILFLSSCGVIGNLKQKNTGKDKQVLLTSMDSVSYLIGAEIGSSFLNNHIDISKDALLRGITDAMQSADTIISEETKEQVMTAFQARLQMADMERREKISAENRQEQEAFLKINKNNPGVFETESGLQYRIIVLGTGEKPSSADTVRVHYEGRFVNGEVFDASRRHSENPVEFPLNRVISGWIEAVQLMPVGSTFELYIPADLGYGERGNERIPPAKMLVFTVELIDIVRN